MTHSAPDRESPQGKPGEGLQTDRQADRQAVREAGRHAADGFRSLIFTHPAGRAEFSDFLFVC